MQTFKTIYKTAILFGLIGLTSQIALGQHKRECLNSDEVRGKISFHFNNGLNYVGSNNLSPFGIDTKGSFDHPGYSLNTQILYHYKTNKAVGLDVTLDQYSAVLSSKQLLNKPTYLFVGLSMAGFHRKTKNYIYHHTVSCGYVYNNNGYRSLDSDAWNSITAHGFGYIHRYSVSRRIADNSWIGMQLGFKYYGTFKWRGDSEMIDKHSYSNILLRTNEYNSVLIPFVGVVFSLI